MLITDLIYELKFNKLKILILFIILSVISFFIIKFGQSKYIKQTIYIEIKEQIDFRLKSSIVDFNQLNLQFNSEGQIDVIKSENRFLSPSHINYSLDLNKNSFYKNLLDEELYQKITNDYRPGYNLLVFYNVAEKRYEVTVQLFDDLTTFTLVIDQIINGVTNYFNQNDFKNKINTYFSKINNNFNIFENNLILYSQNQKNLIKQIELIKNNAKVDLQSLILQNKLLEKNKLNLYISDLDNKLFNANMRLSTVEKILNEFEIKRKQYNKFFDQDNFYNINLSDRTIINRGKFPEYVLVLFIALFVGTSFLISYISLARKK